MALCRFDRLLNAGAVDLRRQRSHEHAFRLLTSNVVISNAEAPENEAH